MKYYKRLDVYKNSTGTNLLDRNRDAYSYNWWKYYDNRTRIFNHSSYSNATSKHQWEMKAQLRRLGLKIGLTLYHTRYQLTNVKDAINEEIQYNERLLKKLHNMQEKLKNTQSKTYVNRQYKIIEVNKRLLELETYKGYLQRAGII